MGKEWVKWVDNEYFTHFIHYFAYFIFLYDLARIVTKWVGFVAGKNGLKKC